MADDDQDKTNEEEEDFGALTGGGDSGDSGIGNLPPLSDFDSADAESDGGLPPIDDVDSDSGGGISGLPPIVDIKVDTPAVRPSDLDTPVNKESDLESPGGFDTPASELDTPDPGQGLGFQDFAADSDFSPETPDIGPGPDSDIETPMFDSAFGGDSDDFATSGPTPAPTQAMETPMFEGGDTGGGDAGGFGFDNDAFGVPTPDVGGDGGTPIPDFSPDTGMPVVEEGGKKGKKKKARAGGGGGGGATTFIVAAVMLIVGLMAGLIGNPFIAKSLPLPNPLLTEIEDLEAQALAKDRTIASMRAAVPEGEVISQEEIDRMTQEYGTVKQQLEQTEASHLAAQENLQGLRQQLSSIKSDIEANNEEFVNASEQLEDLQNEIAITRARHEGLLAENGRLTDQVGELEQANLRRQSTLDTLLHNIDLLTVQVQGGSPLTPERYNHAERLASVNALHSKVSNAKWATPQLLNEYTDLYLSELGIASSREYFFARIPVKDELDVQYYRWAECLMNGNWSVYFRTLDGTHVGSYENTAGEGAPKYEFREKLPAGMKADINDAITSARVDGYENKFEVLKQKEKIYETKSPLQKKFSSL